MITGDARDTDETNRDEADVARLAKGLGVGSTLVDNRQLVHELMLNPPFPMVRTREGQVATRVRHAMTRAFWDRAVAADDVDVVLARTEELRAGFRDAVERGCRSSTTGLPTAELRSDMLQAHVGLLAAVLQRHGVDYEKQQLATRLLEAGGLSAAFPRTIKWLAVELELEVYLTRPDVEKAERARLAESNAEALTRFRRASIWALEAKYSEDPSVTNWPETLELDVERVCVCRDAVDRVAVTATLVALVRDYVTRRSLSTPGGFLERVRQQLGALLASPGVAGAQLVAQATRNVRELEPLVGSEVMERELQALEQRLLGCFAADNAVFQLFFSRAARAVELSALEGDAACTLHASLVPFAADIDKATSVLRRLVEHNERVYTSVYTAIIRRLMSPSTRSEAAV